MRSVLEIIIVSVISVGCGVLERSEYDPGSYQPDRQEGDGSQGKGTDGSDPGLNNPGGKPSALTGLDRCVKKHYEASKVVPFEVPLISQKLSDFDDPKAKLSDAQVLDLFDLLLRAVVSPSGLVNYEALRGTYADQWKLLAESMKAVSAPSPRSVAVAIAFWTNAYNFLMLNQVVEAGGGTDHVLDDLSEPFMRKFLLAGHSLSLDMIEKGILGASGSTDPVPPGLVLAAQDFEPRIHFGLVCGAVSCPKLRPFAYRGESLERVLDENTLMFWNSAYHVRNGERVLFNQILQWYYADFKALGGGSFAGLGKFVVKECRNDIDAIVATMESWDSSPDRSDFWKYDWKINHQ